jgi:hypothetical protein
MTLSFRAPLSQRVQTLLKAADIISDNDRALPLLGLARSQRPANGSQVGIRLIR